MLSRRLCSNVVSTIRFTPLSDADLREAWPNEAHNFTPWLFENMEYLSEVLGIDLEATDREVAVDKFSADIIATDVRTGDRVLIENQLENSDHTHLGQILTYLAGLQAKSIVWVARGFEDDHLSAIRWLNEHTSSDFAFFAVRLRVVRIGDSPFAPVLEVVEKPNNWERMLRTRANSIESPLTGMRRRFWDRYLAKHEGVFKPTRDANIWIPMLRDNSVVLSMYVARNACGMFLRGSTSTHGEEFESILSQYAKELDQVFGPSRSSKKGYFYETWIDIGISEEERWDEIIDWMEPQRQRYAEIFEENET